MAMEFRFGQTELGTKATGNRTRLVAKASSGTLMETYLKASGKMTRQTDTGSIFT